jgi:Uma2 family endonuclease
MTAARTPEYVPYDVFLRMEEESAEKHEWVNGVVYAMTRGTPEHGRLTSRVLRALVLAEGCETFASDTAIFIEAAQQHTYADASVVCGPLVTRTVHDKNGQSIGEAVVNPSLIVEVLSDTTERYDRDGKFEAYKKLPSFQEYVLVSQTERRVEVRTREGSEWKTRVGRAGETVALHGQPIRVDAIYG